jgi:hypothetical protein
MGRNPAVYICPDTGRPFREGGHGRQPQVPAGKHPAPDRPGQIAAEDLSQRVMGDFSASFNAMVEHLAQDEINR